MMNPIIKYLLTLVLLLAGRYSSLSAHTFHRAHTASAITQVQAPEQEGGRPTDQHHTCVFSSPSSDAHTQYNIDVADLLEEEDEVISSKKHLPGGISFVSVLTGASFHLLKQSIFTRGFFAYLASFSSLFLTFRAIRI